MFLRLGMLLIGLPACLSAQAIIEYSLGAATAAGTAAAARRLGLVTSDKIGKIGVALPTPAPRTLQPTTASPPGATPAGTASSAAAPRTSRPATDDPAGALLPLTPAPASPPAPAVSYEDPAGIKEGMDYPEVVRRFGPPSMKLSSSAAGDETLCYSRSGRDLDVQLHAGKVAAVRAAATSAGTLVLR